MSGFQFEKKSVNNLGNKLSIGVSLTNSDSRLFDSQLSSNPFLIISNVNSFSNSINSPSSNKLEFLERNIRWQLIERRLCK